MGGLFITISNNIFRAWHNIGHSVGWVERSETQQLIGVGFHFVQLNLPKIRMA